MKNFWYTIVLLGLYFLLFSVSLCTANENEIKPIAVVTVHMDWINTTNNYLVKIEHYDFLGTLEGTTEMFVDYEISLNLKHFMPDQGIRPLKTLTFPAYHETRIERRGFFRTYGKSTFDPFGDGNADLFVQNQSARETMDRLKRIGKQIRTISGTAERQGWSALCFQYNDTFLEECKKNFSAAGSNYTHELELLSLQGEQQYWFDMTTGELREYVVMQKKSDKNDTSDVLFSTKITHKKRNVEYNENKAIILSLFGQREKFQFDSLDALLNDYHISAYARERYSVLRRVFISLGIGLIVLAVVLKLGLVHK
ncbi:hypothetical protein FACS1894170_11760 [Planctomycetales bacterium]|nr:hypothetical protein FACS1894170_11760 [Planctomycetales bacterium]